MTSADTIGCRLALAREEDGNREMGDRRQETRDKRQETRDKRQETRDKRQETGLWIGDQLQAFDSSKGRFFSHFYIQTSWFSGMTQKRQKAKN
jgi:hypothetical protein